MPSSPRAASSRLGTAWSSTRPDTAASSISNLEPAPHTFRPDLDDFSEDEESVESEPEEDVFAFHRPATGYQPTALTSADGESFPSPLGTHGMGRFPLAGDVERPQTSAGPTRFGYVPPFPSSGQFSRLDPSPYDGRTAPSAQSSEQGPFSFAPPSIIQTSYELDNYSPLPSHEHAFSTLPSTQDNSPTAPTFSSSGSGAPGYTAHTTSLTPLAPIRYSPYPDRRAELIRTDSKNMDGMSEVESASSVSDDLGMSKSAIRMRSFTPLTELRLSDDQLSAQSRGGRRWLTTALTGATTVPDGRFTRAGEERGSLDEDEK